MVEGNRVDDIFPLKNSYNKEDIYKMISSVLPSWQTSSPKDLEVTRCMGATNISFKVKMSKYNTNCEESSSPVLLLKIFWKDVGSIINREKEKLIVEGVSKLNFGPKLLYWGELNAYRLEEYIESSPLTIFEMNNKLYYSTFARKICDFQHSPELNKIVQIFDKDSLFCEFLIDTWLSEFRTNFSKYCSHTAQKENIQILNNYEFMSKPAFIEECRKLLPKNSKWISISHNDISEQNILRKTHQKDDLVLIDFEYSGLNYCAYDFAMYISEAVFDYTYPHYPYYKLYMGNRMRDEDITSFLSAYLTHFYASYYTGEGTLEEYINAELEEFREEVLRIECFSNIFTGIWGFLTIDWGEFDESKEWRYQYAMDKLTIYLQLRDKYI